MQLHKEMTINRRYQDLLREVLLNGDPVAARNHNTLSSITLPILIFDTFPLVTIRKTAWKMALREMEWFLSGETRCPDELLKWWDGQLDSDHHKWLT
jgi:thymidylate synthase